MASKYLNLSGTVKWVNGKFGGLFEPDPEYGNYQLTFYPDMQSWDKIKASGLKLQSKTDDDGDFLKFRRPKEKIINKELVEFGRPKVFFKEGIEGTKDIGNGSSVDVSVVVYKAGPHMGHRLESVTVTDLVQYERSGAVGNFIEYDPQGRKQREDTDNSDSTNDSEQADSKEDTPKGKTAKEQLEVPFDDGVPFGNSKQEEVKSTPKSASPFKRMSR